MPSEWKPNQQKFGAKYKVLGNVLDWATNVGYPGYATAGISEAFSTWVIPTMFAKVARGDESPEDAAKAAEGERPAPSFPPPLAGEG